MIEHFTFDSEELGYYVYVYSDPTDHKPFYIGKGKGNRVFSHLTEARNLKEKGEYKESDISEKTLKIIDILENKEEPVIEILAYGLDEETAKKVEAAAIDLIGVDKLTNEQRGYQSNEYGIINVKTLNATHKKKELTRNDFIDNVVLININELYRHDMTPFELYETVRGYWRLSIERAKTEKYALAVYAGIVLEVYEIKEWFDELSTMMDYRYFDPEEAHSAGEVEKRKKRYEFVGRIAAQDIRDKYIYKSVSSFYSDGKQNPIRYIDDWEENKKKKVKH